MNFSEKLKELRKHKGVTQTQMARELGVALSSIAMWESTTRKPPVETMIKLSKYFGVSVDEMLGLDNEHIDIVSLPVIAKVKAGYGSEMIEIDSGEIQVIPRSIIGNKSEEELMVFLVDGDSMAPKFLEGDRVLVSRQTSVDSGDIAIVSYCDHESGTIKKVHYEAGCDYVDLIPLNPKYSPVRIQGEALEGVRVVGKVIYLFRKI